MKQGHFLLLDEINMVDDSVLERLNSVLESTRTLLLAEKGACPAKSGETNTSLGTSVEVVKAHDAFRVFATMNPGGDYGKKELSPALSNRFVQIFVPSIGTRDDVVAIARSKLKLVRSCAGIRTPLVEFVVDFFLWIAEHQQFERAVSVRDVLAWVQFIARSWKENAEGATLSLGESIGHGMCLVFLDGLELASSLSRDEADAFRREVLRVVARLLETAGLGAAYSLSHRDEEALWVKLSGVLNPSEADLPCFANMDSNEALFAKEMRDDASLQIGYGPFWVRAGPCFESRCLEYGTAIPPVGSFSFGVRGTYLNAMCVMRALQIEDKAILLEGSPGVGKSVLIEAMSTVLGYEFLRINLSDETDMMELMGSNDPVEDGAPGMFEWKDGAFLTAVKNGGWVLLDEINLASQSLLEGLNSILDHRREVYVSDMDQVVRCHPNFRLFAAQNPMLQGGGRRGLPQSFINRFSLVYVRENSFDDIALIAKRVSREISDGTVEHMVKYVNCLHRCTQPVAMGAPTQLSSEVRFGSAGAPWEFNVRDVLRWIQISEKYGIAHVPMLACHLFSRRFRTSVDRLLADEFVLGICGAERSIVNVPTISSVSASTVSVGVATLGSFSPLYFPDCWLFADGYDHAAGQGLGVLTGSQLQALESMAVAVENDVLGILVGENASDRRTVVLQLASLVGAKVEVVCMHSGMDALELIGGYGQAQPIQAKRSVVLMGVSAVACLRQCLWLLRSTLIDVKDMIEFHSAFHEVLRVAAEHVHACDALLKRFGAAVELEVVALTVHLARKQQTLLSDFRGAVSHLPRVMSAMYQLVVGMNDSPGRQSLFRVVARWSGVDDAAAEDHFLRPLLTKVDECVADITVMVQTARNKCDREGKKFHDKLRISPPSGLFEWYDGPLLRCIEQGVWLLLDECNECSAAVLDRLNALVEPGTTFTVHERSGTSGGARVYQPHPNFRIFLSYDPQRGEISRPMRNRAVEVFVDSACVFEVGVHDRIVDAIGSSRYIHAAPVSCAIRGIVDEGVVEGVARALQVVHWGAGWLASRLVGQPRGRVYTGGTVHASISETVHHGLLKASSRACDIVLERYGNTIGECAFDFASALRTLFVDPFCSSVGCGCVAGAGSCLSTSLLDVAARCVMLRTSAFCDSLTSIIGAFVDASVWVYGHLFSGSVLRDSFAPFAEWAIHFALTTDREACTRSTVALLERAQVNNLRDECAMIHVGGVMLMSARSSNALSSTFKALLTQVSSLVQSYVQAKSAVVGDVMTRCLSVTSGNMWRSLRLVPGAATWCGMSGNMASVTAIWLRSYAGGGWVGMSNRTRESIMFVIRLLGQVLSGGADFDTCSVRASSLSVILCLLRDSAHHYWAARSYGWKLFAERVVCFIAAQLGMVEAMRFERGAIIVPASDGSLPGTVRVMCELFAIHRTLCVLLSGQPCSPEILRALATVHYSVGLLLSCTGLACSSAGEYLRAASVPKYIGAGMLDMAHPLVTHGAISPKFEVQSVPPSVCLAGRCMCLAVEVSSAIASGGDFTMGAQCNIRVTEWFVSIVVASILSEDKLGHAILVMWPLLRRSVAGVLKGSSGTGVLQAVDEWCSSSFLRLATNVDTWGVHSASVIESGDKMKDNEDTSAHFLPHVGDKECGVDGASKGRANAVAALVQALTREPVPRSSLVNEMASRHGLPEVPALRWSVPSLPPPASTSLVDVLRLGTSMWDACRVSSEKGECGLPSASLSSSADLCAILMRFVGPECESPYASITHYDTAMNAADTRESLLHASHFPACLLLDANGRDVLMKSYALAVVASVRRSGGKSSSGGQGGEAHASGELLRSVRSVLAQRHKATSDLVALLKVSPMSVLIDSTVADGDFRTGQDFTDARGSGSAVSGARKDRLETAATMARLLPVEDLYVLRRLLLVAVDIATTVGKASKVASPMLASQIGGLIEYGASTTSLSPTVFVNFVVAMWFMTQKASHVGDPMSSAMSSVSLSSMFDVFRASWASAGGALLTARVLNTYGRKMSESPVNVMGPVAVHPWWNWGVTFVALVEEVSCACSTPISAFASVSQRAQRLSYIVGASSSRVSEGDRSRTVLVEYCCLCLRYVLLASAAIKNGCHNLESSLQSVSDTVCVLGRMSVDELVDLLGDSDRLLSIERVCGTLAAVGVVCIGLMAHWASIRESGQAQASGLRGDISRVVDGIAVAVSLAALLHMVVPRIPLDVVDRIGTVRRLREQSQDFVRADGSVWCATGAKTSDSPMLLTESLHGTPPPLSRLEGRQPDVLECAVNEARADQWMHCCRATGSEGSTASFGDLFVTLVPLVGKPDSPGVFGERGILSFMTFLLTAVLQGEPVRSVIVRSPLGQWIYVLLRTGTCRSLGDAMASMEMWESRFADVLTDSAGASGLMTGTSWKSAREISVEVEMKEQVLQSFSNNFVGRIEKEFMARFRDVCEPIVGAVLGVRSGIRMACCATLALGAVERQRPLVIERAGLKTQTDCYEVMHDVLVRVVDPLSMCDSARSTKHRAPSLSDALDLLAGPAIMRAIDFIKSGLVERSSAGDGRGARAASVNASRTFACLLEQAMAVGCRMCVIGGCVSAKDLTAMNALMHSFVRSWNERLERLRERTMEREATYKQVQSERDPLLSGKQKFKKRNVGQGGFDEEVVDDSSVEVDEAWWYAANVNAHVAVDQDRALVGDSAGGADSGMLSTDSLDGEARFAEISAECVSLQAEKAESNVEICRLLAQYQTIVRSMLSRAPSVSSPVDTFDANESGESSASCHKEAQCAGQWDGYLDLVRRGAIEGLVRQKSGSRRGQALLDVKGVCLHDVASVDIVSSGCLALEAAIIERSGMWDFPFASLRHIRSAAAGGGSVGRDSMLKLTLELGGFAGGAKRSAVSLSRQVLHFAAGMLQERSGLEPLAQVSSPFLFSCVSPEIATASNGLLLEELCSSIGEVRLASREALKKNACEDGIIAEGSLFVRDAIRILGLDKEHRESIAVAYVPGLSTDLVALAMELAGRSHDDVTRGESSSTKRSGRGSGRTEYILPQQLYSEAFMRETVLVVQPVRNVLKHIVSLLGKFEVHAGLLVLHRICDRILALPLRVPLLEVRAHLEQLWWQLMAMDSFGGKSVYALESLIAPVSKLLSRWRKMEVRSWPMILRACETNVAVNGLRLWQKLFSVVEERIQIEVDAACGDADSDKACTAVGTMALSKEIFGVCHDFLTMAMLGDFGPRLALVEMYAASLLLRGQLGAPLFTKCDTYFRALAQLQGSGRSLSISAYEREVNISLGTMMLSLCRYYSRFLPGLRALRQNLAFPVLQDLRDFALIGKWDEKSYAMQRSVTKKIQRFLRDLKRKYTSVLKKGLTEFFTSQLHPSMISTSAAAGATVGAGPEAMLAPERTDLDRFLSGKYVDQQRLASTVFVVDARIKDTAAVRSLSRRVLATLADSADEVDVASLCYWKRVGDDKQVFVSVAAAYDKVLAFERSAESDVQKLSALWRDSLSKPVEVGAPTSAISVTMTAPVASRVLACMVGEIPEQLSLPGRSYAAACVSVADFLESFAVRMIKGSHSLAVGVVDSSGERQLATLSQKRTALTRLMRCLKHFIAEPLQANTLKQSTCREQLFSLSADTRDILDGRSCGHTCEELSRSGQRAAYVLSAPASITSSFAAQLSVYFDAILHATAYIRQGGDIGADPDLKSHPQSGHLVTTSDWMLSGLCQARMALVQVDRALEHVRLVRHALESAMTAQADKGVVNSQRQRFAAAAVLDLWKSMAVVMCSCGVAFSRDSDDFLLLPKYESIADSKVDGIVGKALDGDAKASLSQCVTECAVLASSMLGQAGATDVVATDVLEEMCGAVLKCETLSCIHDNAWRARDRFCTASYWRESEGCVGNGNSATAMEAIGAWCVACRIGDAGPSYVESIVSLVSTVGSTDGEEDVEDMGKPRGVGPEGMLSTVLRHCRDLPEAIGAQAICDLATQCDVGALFHQSLSIDAVQGKKAVLEKLNGAIDECLAFEKWVEVAQAHVNVLLRGVYKLVYVFVSIARTLLCHGFCRSEEDDGSGDGDGDDEFDGVDKIDFGIGMDDAPVADDAKDVSNEITNEDQVTGLQQEDQLEDKQDEKREAPKEEQDGGLEMNEEFDGAMGDVAPQDDDDTGKQDEGEELDRQMADDGDDDGMDRVDERLAGSEDEEDGEGTPEERTREDDKLETDGVAGGDVDEMVANSDDDDDGKQDADEEHGTDEPDDNANARDESMVEENKDADENEAGEGDDGMRDSDDEAVDGGSDKEEIEVDSGGEQDDAHQNKVDPAYDGDDDMDNLDLPDHVDPSLLGSDEENEADGSSHEMDEEEDKDDDENAEEVEKDKDGGGDVDEADMDGTENDGAGEAEAEAGSDEDSEAPEADATAQDDTSVKDSGDQQDGDDGDVEKEANDGGNDAGDKGGDDDAEGGEDESDGQDGDDDLKGEAPRHEEARDRMPVKDSNEIFGENERWDEAAQEEDEKNETDDAAGATGGSGGGDGGHQGQQEWGSDGDAPGNGGIDLNPPKLNRPRDHKRDPNPLDALGDALKAFAKRASFVDGASSDGGDRNDDDGDKSVNENVADDGTFERMQESEEHGGPQDQAMGDATEDQANMQKLDTSADKQREMEDEPGKRRDGREVVDNAVADDDADDAMDEADTDGDEADDGVGDEQDDAEAHGERADDIVDDGGEDAFDDDSSGCAVQPDGSDSESEDVPHEGAEQEDGDAEAGGEDGDEMMGEGMEEDNGDAEVSENDDDADGGSGDEVINCESAAPMTGLPSSYGELVRAVSVQSKLLCEQLRTVLEPTQAASFKGDYQTGKRLNMRRIIPYIASDFKRDKIWLRRTKPSKRCYQVLVAIDNSLSMQHNSTAVRALEGLALVSEALSQLDVGECGVVRFGAESVVLHPLGAPWSASAGASVLNQLRFNEQSTNARSLVQCILDALRAARASASSSQSELWQLAFIISDGELTCDRSVVARLVRQALDERVCIVVLVFSERAGKEDAEASDMGHSGAPPRKDIARMKIVEWDKHGNPKMKPYLDGFPFPLYVLVYDMALLPLTLADTLRSWMQLAAQRVQL